MIRAPQTDVESTDTAARRRREFLNGSDGGGAGGSVMFRLEPATGQAVSPRVRGDGQGPPSSGGRRVRAHTKAFEQGAVGTPMSDYDQAGAGVESPHLPQIQQLGTQLGLVRTCMMRRGRVLCGIRAVRG